MNTKAAKQFPQIIFSLDATSPIEQPTKRRDSLDNEANCLQAMRISSGL